MEEIVAKLFALSFDSGAIFAEENEGPTALQRLLRGLGVSPEVAVYFEGEKSALAWVGLVAGITLAFAFGPLVAAGVGVATLGPVGAAVATAVIEGIITQGVENVANFLDLIKRPDNLAFSRGVNFNLLADSSYLQSGETLIRVVTDPKSGASATTLINFPLNAPDVAPNQVDVLLQNGQYLTFQKGAFSQLVNSGDFGTAQTFTAFLQNSQSHNLGELKVNTGTNDVKFLSSEGTVADLGTLSLNNGANQLAISLTSSGDPQVAIIDAASGLGTTGGLNIHQNLDGSIVVTTNVENASIFFGSSIDTLADAGANDTLFAGSAQYQMPISGTSLSLDQDTSIAPPSGFIESKGPVSAGSGDAEIVVAGGNGQTATANQPNEILVAAGTTDVLNATANGQALVGLGQSGDTLLGNTATGTNDVLIADKGNPITAPSAGIDTLVANAGDNVMIGDGVNATFDINASDPSSVDVVWGGSAADTISISGYVQVIEIRDPDVTAASVANVDAQALYSGILEETGLNHIVNFQHFSPPVPVPINETTVIVINPTSSESLYFNGEQFNPSGAAEPGVNTELGLQPGEMPLAFLTGAVSPDGLQEDDVDGFSQGDFGITVPADGMPVDRIHPARAAFRRGLISRNLT